MEFLSQVFLHFFVYLLQKSNHSTLYPIASHLDCSFFSWYVTIATWKKRRVSEHRVIPLCFSDKITSISIVGRDRSRCSLYVWSADFLLGVSWASPRLLIQYSFIVYLRPMCSPHMYSREIIQISCRWLRNFIMAASAEIESWSSQLKSKQSSQGMHGCWENG